MSNQDVKSFIGVSLTVTFCIAFLLWGSVVVFRSVTDANYHAPTAKDVYVSCTLDAAGTNNQAQCQKIAGIK